MTMMLDRSSSLAPATADADRDLRTLLNPGGRLFGATLIQGDVPPSPAAAALMRWFNARGTLHNQADTRTRLVEGLERHLNEVRVEQVGCVALFSGRA